MKPDKVTCNNCGIQILKGKWCSDKCRKAYSRKSDNPDTQVGQKSDILVNKSDKINPDTDKSDKISTKSDKLGQLTEVQVGQTDDITRTELTATDKTFYDRAMKDFNEPYYNFNSSERTLKCAYCGKEYTTCLSLNRYCCYEHYKTAITTVK